MEAGSQIMDVFITDLSKELEFYTPKISVSEVEKWVFFESSGLIIFLA